MKKFVIALSLVSMMFVSGCSFINSTIDDDLVVSCDATNPVITINGQRYRQELISVSVDKGEKVAVSCRADGYYTAHKNIDTELSTTGALDIVGGFFFLFPWLGLLSDGAWTIEDDEVYMSLEHRPQVQQYVAPIQPSQPTSIIINNHASKQ
ncbi:hypothetical protein BIY21_06415 [Vibrio ponticus]|uniref:PEGA domain-containing protein n=1 Tax=Vibrio ponticus TaxID=265668 RepID=A0ABX3FQ61_9VIBR|nr:hypothetical protein [Vibrio ponticus]OLQ95334.1 hypothetical protein BIY21_06415 [Vibrio ponticus]